MSAKLEDFDFAAVVQRQREEFEKNRPERVAFFRSRILPTYIDQWPVVLHNLSVKTAWIDFPVREYDRAEMGEGDVEPFLRAIEWRIDQLRKDIPADTFYRLGSRSPKDWWYGHPDVGEDAGAHQPRLASAPDIARSFLLSERVNEDLFDAKDAGYNPVFVARAWVQGIEPFREFRCFMRSRELAGISVYRAWDSEPRREITENPRFWQERIREWFPRFAAIAPMDDVVFDVVVLNDRVVLLETNPDLNTTYPGHFLGKPLDGRFRFLGDGDSTPVC